VRGGQETRTDDLKPVLTLFLSCTTLPLGQGRVELVYTQRLEQLSSDLSLVCLSPVSPFLLGQGRWSWCTRRCTPRRCWPPRDFCTLRYTTLVEDGVVVCERSLTDGFGGASMPAVASFVRADMHPSGFLIRSCAPSASAPSSSSSPSPSALLEGLPGGTPGGAPGATSIVIGVDHQDLQARLVPDLLRPLYMSSTALAERSTLAAVRCLRRAAAAEGAAREGAGRGGRRRRRRPGRSSSWLRGAPSRSALPCE